MIDIKTGDRVNIKSLSLTGTIFSIHRDDRQDGIYMILLDRSDETPDGFYYARDYELEIV